MFSIPPFGHRRPVFYPQVPNPARPNPPFVPGASGPRCLTCEQPPPPAYRGQAPDGRYYGHDVPHSRQQGIQGFGSWLSDQANAALDAGKSAAQAEIEKQVAANAPAAEAYVKQQAEAQAKKVLAQNQDKIQAAKVAAQAKLAEVQDSVSAKEKKITWIVYGAGVFGVLCVGVLAWLYWDTSKKEKAAKKNRSRRARRNVRRVRNKSLTDATFMGFVDVMSERFDKERARAYGLKHWAELSDDSRRAWDWSFGRESRLPGWMTRDLRRLNRIAESEDVDV